MNFRGIISRKIKVDLTVIKRLQISVNDQSGWTLKHLPSVTKHALAWVVDHGEKNLFHSFILFLDLILFPINFTWCNSLCFFCFSHISLFSLRAVSCNPECPTVSYFGLWSKPPTSLRISSRF